MLGKKKDKKDGKEDKKDKDNKDNKDSPAQEPTKVPSVLPPHPVVPLSPAHHSAEDVKKEEERKQQEEERRRKEEEDKKRAQDLETKRIQDQRKSEEMALKQKQEEDKRRQLELEEEKKKQQQQEEEKRKLELLAAKQREEEEAKLKKTSDDVSEEVEIQSLEAVKADLTESKTIYKEVYDLFPADVFASYDKLQSFARDLNTQIPVLELVILGPKGSGKSSVIEALLGRSITHSFVTKRPLYLQLTNNLDCEVPKITVKRDPVLAEFNHDVEVPLEALPEALAARNKTVTAEPIFVHYEYKSCLNFTIIDTPGLSVTSDADSANIENIVTSIARLSHRYLLVVEQAADLPNSHMTAFAKKVDPELSRSTFVYTKFFSQLQDFNNTRAVNRFLSSTSPDVKSFFVTIPSAKVRVKFPETEKLQEKVWQAYRRDMNLLEQLQYDKRYERNIGVHSLRKWLLNQIWRNYQESIPRILKHLRSRKAHSEKRLEEIQAQITGLDSLNLRSVASNYVVNFLQIVEQLLAGTSEGHPAINGQTLEEEKTQQAEGDWLDANNRPIRFAAKEWGIQYWDAKLYGGQQFERLLAEFKAVSEHTEISEVTMDDVATAAGINKLNNVPNYAWAASDLAQQKTQDAMVPLIEQLCERAVYIMKRLTDIAEKVVDSRRKKWQSSYRDSKAEALEQSPYFTHHVKDLYFKFVDQTAKQVKSKCMDEFLSTRTIYWDLTEHPDRSIPLSNNQEDTKTAVVELSRQLFNSLRSRIMKNVLLKFYNFFLVPMQTDLWSEIQGKVTSLSDASLTQIFEVKSTKDKLVGDEKSLKANLQKMSEQDVSFLDASTQFCHPIIINQLE